ncbi:dephospho-CoA kinase family [Striga asiatica]|uniref:Dephospho-CoA kinase family n=1 Tax=Striga asiatica TaxID=4170 RepID=A0A5A7Q0D5_STRAF|nr:dephospho-CoA kinase family [Striga asiatica]
MVDLELKTAERNIHSQRRVSISHTKFNRKTRRRRRRMADLKRSETSGKNLSPNTREGRKQRKEAANLGSDHLKAVIEANRQPAAEKPNSPRENGSKDEMTNLPLDCGSHIRSTIVKSAGIHFPGQDENSWIDRRHKLRKSTVSNLFKAHGIPVVDADVIARNVLKKGTGGWRKVVAAFGDEILLSGGEVDRLKLGQIVFNDSDRRQLLNRLLAPYISFGILLDVPLLFEAKMDRWTKPIIVVWASPKTQLKRLMLRDGSTAEEAQSRINAQMPLDLKKSKADIVIDNSGSLGDLNERFEEVLVQLPFSFLALISLCKTATLKAFRRLKNSSPTNSSTIPSVRDKALAVASRVISLKKGENSAVSCPMCLQVLQAKDDEDLQMTLGLHMSLWHLDDVTLHWDIMNNKNIKPSGFHMPSFIVGVGVSALFGALISHSANNRLQHVPVRSRQ